MSVFPLELNAQLGVRVVKVPQYVLWPMTAEETLCVCIHLIINLVQSLSLSDSL